MARVVRALDFDDVLFPMVENFVPQLNEKYKTNVSVDQLSSYNFSHLFKLTTQQMAAEMRAFHEQDMLEIPPKPGVQESVARLATKSELIIVTARSSWLRKSTESYVDKYFPGMFSGVILLGHKNGIELTCTKGEKCKKIGATALIDDAPHNIESLEGTGIHGVLFGQYAWQHNVRVKKGHVRKRTWPKVVEHFESGLK